ncbi:MAG TPA: hypothetical protein VFQ43_15240 [Nitrososphaera sp.]|nr:hypothetical protein [Nitrososphaera sp.]
MKKQMIRLTISLLLLVGACSTQQMLDGGGIPPLCGPVKCN